MCVLYKCANEDESNMSFINLKFFSVFNFIYEIGSITEVIDVFRAEIFQQFIKLKKKRFKI